MYDFKQEEEYYELHKEQCLKKTVVIRDSNI